jgi:hypothetical protein
MKNVHRDFEVIEGMLAIESPQRTAERILDLLRRGEMERVREIMRERAARVSASIASDLAAAERA